MKTNNVQITKNFTMDEFRCKCGCGDADVSLALIEAVQKIRDIVNAPVIVRSGKRCLTHNKNCGGAKFSMHLRGSAADLACPSVPLARLYDAATQVPEIHGIGIYPKQGFIHVDIRETTARWGDDGTSKTFASCLGWIRGLAADKA